ncbi:hypothetical protein LX36DRAFT_662209, partial [Colletotrichum falcatum]
MALTGSPSSFDWDAWSEVESINGGTPAASSRAATQQPTSDGRLPLLRLIEWDEFRNYDERHRPVSITLLMSKDSEPNLVLAPSDFWELTLRSKLNSLVTKKLATNKTFKPDDTTVTVSVRDRAEEDLVKRFDDLDIQWEVVEMQL